MMKKNVLTLVILIVFSVASIGHAKNCQIIIKSFNKGGKVKVIDEVAVLSVKEKSFSRCSDNAKKTLKDIFGLGKRIQGTLSDGEKTFKGSYLKYYFAEIHFDDFEYDLGFRDSFGRVQAHRPEISISEIRDEKGNVVFKFPTADW